MVVDNNLSINNLSIKIRNLDLEEMDKINALIDKFDEYITFLDRSSQGPVSVAYAHGWKCDQVTIDKGEALRAEIEELRKDVR